MDQLDKYLDILREMVVSYGVKLIGAVIALIIGLWIIKMITKGVVKMMRKREVDESLVPFLSSMVNVILKILLVISIMSMMGIAMTSFVAILGAAGLAIGMALSGTLQNFAGGVMILIFKPYKVSDFIEAQGYMGVVKEIQIFNTILTTVDNKTVIIPNGGLSTGSVTNFSTQPTRRVDFTFGIAYGDDLEKAKGIIKTIAEKDSRVLKSPEPFVRMSELADSSVNITARFWANAADYWDVYFDTMETVYAEFTKENINIPFPQMDVHMHNN